MIENLSPNARGMLAMTCASILFVFSDALSKLASLHWSVAQLLTIRGAFGVAIATAFVLAMGEGRKLALAGHPLLLLRGTTEMGIAMLFISSLSRMPLADLTSILMLSPLVITAFAVLFLGEKVGWRRAAAIAVGFAGLLLVVQPGQSHGADPQYLFAAGLGLATVFAVAVRDIITRRLDRGIPSVVVTFVTACGSCLAGVLLSAIEPWQPFAWAPLLYSLGAALIMTFGNLLIIIACRGVELSTVAPFRYSSVIWSIGVGYLLFGSVPGTLSLCGMAIIVTSGLYLMHRERVRGQRLSA